MWISTHDINPDLGCYRGIWPGAEAAHTPNVDALAEEGVRFDNAFATTPVCAPSRSSIMTGCFPTAIGTHNMRSKAIPPPEVRLLSEYFRMAGYFATNNVFTDFQVHLPGTAFDDCSPTAHWRDRPDTAQPFFAAFHGMATHESQIYLDDTAFAERTAGLSPDARHDPADVPVPPYHPDTEAFRTAWARYHDLVTVMDGWVGNILAQIEEDGLVDNTIVVFWSDHGAGFPRAKRWATEAGLRIPLIVRYPGKVAGGRARTDVVHLADIAPTMLSLAGIEIPEHMQMTPLFDADGEDREQGEYVFGARDRMDEQRDSSRTVRDERYRYIRHRHPDRSPMQLQQFAEKFPTWQNLRTLVNEEARQLAAGMKPDQLSALQRRVTGPRKPAHELYDLSVDPHETTNLVGDVTHADTLERLSSALDGWLSEFDDLGLIDEEELMDRWWPEGRTPVTAKPVASSTDDGSIQLSCETEGALIGWTADPPQPDAHPLSFQDTINGAPESDGRRWKIVTAALEPSSTPKWVRAWRLGYHGSEEITVTPAAKPVDV